MQELEFCLQQIHWSILATLLSVVTRNDYVVKFEKDTLIIHLEGQYNIYRQCDSKRPGVLSYS